MREALQAAYNALTDAGLDGSCHDSKDNSQYKTVFTEYVLQGIAQYNRVDGHVTGIGAGKINTVFRTSAMPWKGSQTGTVRRPRQDFGETPVVPYVVVVQINEDGTHMLCDFEEKLVPPINILTIEDRHYAVFEPKSTCGNQRFGFLFVTEGDITQFGVDVSMSVGVEEPDKGDFQTVMCNGMLLTQQRKPNDRITTPFYYDTMTRAFSVSHSFRLRIQLVGSRGKPNAPALVGYEGLNEIPSYYLDFLQTFFGGYQHTDSVREGVIWANIESGAVLEGDSDDHGMNRNVMGVYTASDSMDAIVHLTLGVVQYDVVTEPTETPAVPAAPVLRNDNGFVVKLGHAGNHGRFFFDGSRKYYCNQLSQGRMVSVDQMEGLRANLARDSRQSVCRVCFRV